MCENMITDIKNMAIGTSTVSYCNTHPTSSMKHGKLSKSHNYKQAEASRWQV